MNRFRFPIGTKYTHRVNGNPKYTREAVIIDQWTTTNAAGEVVRRVYVTAHGVAGQVVTNYDVCDTTIARALLPEYTHLLDN